MLKKQELIEGDWYRGRGRNANIGMWNGMCFMTFGKRFNEWVVKLEGHWDDEGPFKPLERLY